MPDSKTQQTAVRRELYDQIVREVQAGLNRYYIEFPDRLSDERARDAMEWSLRGIQRILRLLDNYDLSLKRPP